MENFELSQVAFLSAKPRKARYTAAACGFVCILLSYSRQGQMARQTPCVCCTTVVCNLRTSHCNFHLSRYHDKLSRDQNKLWVVQSNSSQWVRRYVLRRRDFLGAQFHVLIFGICIGIDLSETSVFDVITSFSAVYIWSWTTAHRDTRTVPSGP